MKNTCDPCPSCPAAEVDPGLAFLALPLVQPTGKVMGGGGGGVILQCRIRRRGGRTVGHC